MGPISSRKLSDPWPTKVSHFLIIQVFREGMVKDGARFQQIFQCKVKSRTITKYRSTATGLTVTHIDSEGPIVKGYFTLATEETSHDGLPHTLEHLIFLGSKQYPYKGVLDLAANRCLAQGTNAWTSIDHTCYTVETAGSEGFLVLLPVYLDHILFPTLTDPGFVTEVHHVNGTGDDAGVVYCEMQARENDEASRGEHALQEAVFKNECGYKWETGGLMENLRSSCSNEKVRAYHKKFYRPENLDVIICGQIDPTKIFSAIEPIDDLAAKADYGPYCRPWQGQVELFDSFETHDALFPAKIEDNGRVLMTWRGPDLKDARGTEAHMTLLNYMIDTSAAPLVKSLIDIPEPCCSSISLESEEFPKTLVTLKFKGVQSNKHRELREVFYRTFKQTLQGNIDMARLKNQIKNNISNFADRLENDPSETLAMVTIVDGLYGGEDHQGLTEFTKMFDILKDLQNQDESFWKQLLHYYIEEPCVTINCIPSTKFMENLETTEKQRVSEQQKKLGPEGMSAREKHVNECIEFNEKGEDEVEEIIDNLPQPKIGDGLNFHRVNTHCEPVAGVFTHDIDSEFVRFCFVFDTRDLADEEKSLLGLYSSLFCDTPLQFGGVEVAHEDAIRLKEELLLKASCIAGGPEIESFTELVTMEFKFMIDDLDKCKDFIKSLICKKIFTEDRVTTGLKKLSSKVDTGLRKAGTVLSQIYSAASFNGSCKSNMNAFYLQEFFKRAKDNEPLLIAKLTDLQQKLFLNNKIVLHIITSGKILNTHFPASELTCLRKLYNLSAPSHPSTLPSHFRRTFETSEKVLHVVPTDESSYLFLTLPVDLSYSHQDTAAVRLMAEYLGQLEGPFWKQIRGQGFAYSYSLVNSPATGNLIFYLGRATNVSKGYLAAKETIDGIITEGKLDETQIDTAKGAIACGIIQRYETPFSSAWANILNIHRDVSSEYNFNMLKQVADLSCRELLDVCERYFQPLFTGKANVVVCCPEMKRDEIVADLTGMDLPVKCIANVVEYVKALNGCDVLPFESLFNGNGGI